MTKTCNFLPTGLKQHPQNQEVPVQWETFEEENFTNFKVLWLFTKVFSAKFGGVASFGGTSE